MNKKILNLTTAITMLVAFFIPWVKSFGFGGRMSAYNVIKLFFQQIKYIKEQPFMLYSLLLLIFPISAIIIILFYLNTHISEKNAKTVNFIKKTPLSLIIIALIFILIKSKGNLHLKEIIDSKMYKIIDFGFVLTIISAIALFFDKTQATVSQQNIDEVTIKPDKDDLFN